MAAPTLTSISPSAGPPGTAVVCSGAGFDPGARVGCPALVDTEWVSATEVRAAIPAGIVGTGAVPLSVYVMNEDGLMSAILTFTVRFGAVGSQTWTTIEQVCGEVPVFKRGGTIRDETLEGWMRSIAQSVNAAMLGRGLSLDPADWQQPDATTAQPSPAAVLELIVRYGAAARLAAVIGSQFSGGQGEWALAKTLRADFERELKALSSGAYDKMFKPGAATVETGTLAGGGDIATSSGEVEPLFKKDQVF